MDEEDTSKASTVEVPEVDASFPMRSVAIGPVYFNPVVSLIATCSLWGLAGYCMAEPLEARQALSDMMKWASEGFTWFFIGVPAVFFFLLIYVGIKYGHQKLGKATDEPEFDDPTYFAMIFSAGVAVGLFFFGVDEPLYHQVDNRFAKRGYLSQDEIDYWSLTLTIFHWGFAAWSVYSIVALSLGLAAYRDGLPLTFRSCFYPVLGERIWGWMGDLIDSVTIVTVVAGVCTSLGLGALQITNGLVFTGAVDSTLTDQQFLNINILVIWIVTLVATLSVVSGLELGIQYLSRIGFILGCMLWFLVTFLDSPAYIANFIVQTTGHYFQYGVIQMLFETDALGQLQYGQGRAIDGKAAEAYWMNAWTVFYWAWWTSWSGFVGIFLARISKGRTVREVIAYCLILPVLYSIVWFGAFGPAGFRHTRKAKELIKLGMDVFGDAGYFLQDGSTTCYDPPLPGDAIYAQVAAAGYNNYEPGIGPYCLFYTLKNGTLEWDGGYAGTLWYHTLNAYYDYGQFLCWMSIICVAIYFVTSSDSGSFVVDHLAANGHLKHHWSQKVYWAITEGALASALLYAGGNDGLRALQAASIFVGLPFDMLLCVLAISFIRNLTDFERKEKAKKEGTQDELEERKSFNMSIFGGVFDIFEVILSLGKIPQSRNVMTVPTAQTWGSFLLSTLLPFLPLSKALNSSKGKYGALLAASHSICVYTALVLYIVSTTVPRIEVYALLVYITGAFVLTFIRSSARQTYGIYGNAAEDFFCCLFLYPQVILQLVAQEGDIPVAEGNVEPKEVESALNLS